MADARKRLRYFRKCLFFIIIFRYVHTNDAKSIFKICVFLGQSNGSWEQRLKYGTLRAFLTGFRFVFVNAFLLGFSLLITILPLGMKISIRMSLWTPNNKPRSACQSRGSLNYKQTRQSITFASVILQHCVFISNQRRHFFTNNERSGLDRRHGDLWVIHKLRRQDFANFLTPPPPSVCKFTTYEVA